MLHIWWSCPLIQSFWISVHETIKQVTSENLSFTPLQYLLHYNSIPRKQYLKSLSMIMINAARQCIPCHWRSPHIPTKMEWFRRINNIERVEEIISISQERIIQFSAIWSNWTAFKVSQNYQQAIT